MEFLAIFGGHPRPYVDFIFLMSVCVMMMPAGKFGWTEQRGPISMFPGSNAVALWLAVLALFMFVALAPRTWPFLALNFVLLSAGFFAMQTNNSAVYFRFPRQTRKRFLMLSWTLGLCLILRGLFYITVLHSG